MIRKFNNVSIYDYNSARIVDTYISGFRCFPIATTITAKNSLDSISEVNFVLARLSSISIINSNAIAKINCDLYVNIHAPLNPFDILCITLQNISHQKTAIIGLPCRKDPTILPSFPRQGMSCIGNTNIPVASLRLCSTLLRHCQQTRAPELFEDLGPLLIMPMILVPTRS